MNTFSQWHKAFCIISYSLYKGESKTTGSRVDLMPLAELRVEETVPRMYLAHALGVLFFSQKWGIQQAGRMHEKLHIPVVFSARQACEC